MLGATDKVNLNRELQQVRRDTETLAQSANELVQDISVARDTTRAALGDMRSLFDNLYKTIAKNQHLLNRDDDDDDDDDGEFDDDDTAGRVPSRRCAVLDSVEYRALRCGLAEARQHLDALSGILGTLSEESFDKAVSESNSSSAE